MKNQIIKNIEDLKSKISSVEDQMNYFDVSEHYDEDDFYNDSLEDFGSVTIAGMEFDELRILRELDPNGIQRSVPGSLQLYR